MTDTSSTDTRNSNEKTTSYVSFGANAQYTGQRYYAYIDPNTRIVKEWVITYVSSTLPEYREISEQQFNSRDMNKSYKFDENWNLVTFVPPFNPVLFKMLAKNAMGEALGKAPMVVAMGGTFGPKMRAYVNALKAIVNGQDTTSQTLPTAPDDPED